MLASMTVNAPVALRLAMEAVNAGLDSTLLAAAVMAAAKEKNITAEEPTDFASVTGKGVTGTVGRAWQREADGGPENRHGRAGREGGRTPRLRRHGPVRGRRRQARRRHRQSRIPSRRQPGRRWTACGRTASTS
jgi:hypothetical protein